MLKVKYKFDNIFPIFIKVLITMWNKINKYINSFERITRLSKETINICSPSDWKLNEQSGPNK